MWCVWGPDDGWHCEIADGLVTAHPLNSDGDELEPPATVWRSFKGDRSYLYDLNLRETFGEHAAVSEGVAALCRRTLISTAAPRFRQRWHRSATRTACGAPSA